MMTHPEGLTLLNSFDIEKELLPLDKSYYMGVYSLCFHRQNIRNFVNVSSVIFGC